MNKILFRLVVLVLSILIVFILFANVWVIGSTRKQVYSAGDIVPKRWTALVLGTSYNTAEGDGNPFFNERINTAGSVFHLGKVNQIILSGFKTKYYNEPLAMRNSLVERNVPDSILVLDDGGLRTLDSVVRCKELFNRDSVIIITQKFHAYRALFISNYYQMKAIVVVTKKIESPNRKSVLFREFLARPLAVIDLYILHRKPRFTATIIN